MGRRTKNETALKREEYRERIFRPEFRNKSNAAQGRELGVGGNLITKWRSEISASRWREILEMTREQAAEPTLEVDDALFAAARSGDVGAMRLWYEIHGWSPKQNLEITRGRDEDLTAEETVQAIKDAFLSIPEGQRASLLESLKGRAVLDVESEGRGGG